MCSERCVVFKKPFKATEYAKQSEAVELQQHQFDSFESAIAYLKERDIGNTLKYWGWIGDLNGYLLYSFTAKTGIKYDLEVYRNGLVRIKE